MWRIWQAPMNEVVVVFADRVPGMMARLSFPETPRLEHGHLPLSTAYKRQCLKEKRRFRSVRGSERSATAWQYFVFDPTEASVCAGVRTPGRLIADKSVAVS
jgi:hypothetical protein